jgi:hypothetical protein
MPIAVVAGSIARLGLLRVQNAKIAGSLAGRCDGKAFGAQAALHQLAHGCGAAWHPLLKAKVVNRRQFFGIEHDLQPFRPLELCWHMRLRIFAETHFTHLADAVNDSFC